MRRVLMRRWANSKDHLWRGLYLLAVFSFLLPFVTVYTRGCGSHVRTGEVHEYTGFQLFTKPAGWLYLLPISLALLLLVLTFLRQNDAENLRGFLRSWKAALSALSAGVVLVLPGLQFLFDDVDMRIGQGLALASWTVTYIVNLVGATIIVIKSRRSRALPDAIEPRRFVALRVAYAVFALAPIAVSILIILSSKPRNAADVTGLGAVVAFALSMCMVLYFADRGLGGGEAWAAGVGRWTVLLLCIGVVVSPVVTRLAWELGSAGTADAAVGVFLVWLVVTALTGMGAMLFCYLSPKPLRPWLRRLASRLRRQE